MEDFKKQDGNLLIPLSAPAFLEQIRKIIREELMGIEHVKLSPPPGMTEKPLFTTREITKLFSITKPTVYQWIKAGKLKPVKIRSRVYFRGSDVKALMGDVMSEKMTGTFDCRC